MPVSTSRNSDGRRSLERRRQIRGLLLLALAVLLFSILKTGVHRVFAPAGWWRLW